MVYTGLSREIEWSDATVSEGEDNDSSGEEQEGIPATPTLQDSISKLELGLIGFMVDERNLSVSTIQQAINANWTLQGTVDVIGKQGRYFVFDFQIREDMEFVHRNSPLAIEGAFFAFDKWVPGMILSTMTIDRVSIWVQFHGIPLEYINPNAARELGACLGEVEAVDWEPGFPRNMSFSRVFVWINPHEPLIPGFYLRVRGEYKWIVCRYERVFEHCLSCGRIGHTYDQCRIPLAERTSDYDHLLRDISLRLNLDIRKGGNGQKLYEPQIRASYGRRSRRTTRIDSRTLTLNSSQPMEGTTIPPAQTHQPPANANQNPNLAQPQVDNDSVPEGFSCTEFQDIGLGVEEVVQANEEHNPVNGNVVPERRVDSRRPMMPEVRYSERSEREVLPLSNTAANGHDPLPRNVYSHRPMMREVRYAERGVLSSNTVDNVHDPPARNMYSRMMREVRYAERTERGGVLPSSNIVANGHDPPARNMYSYWTREAETTEIGVLPRSNTAANNPHD